MPRTAQEVDEIAGDELKLFIENDGDLYRQQTTPIMKNLMGKLAKGQYSKSKAPKQWSYLVESGAKKYIREVGGGSLSWNEMFPKPTRDYVAARLAREYEHALLNGEYDGMIGEWVPKKYQGEFTTGRGAAMRNPGSRRNGLPSESNTPATEKKVLAAARRILRRRSVRADFEHGHWWVTDTKSGAQYDVVDTNDGFDLEMVTEPDEDYY